MKSAQCNATVCHYYRYALQYHVNTCKQCVYVIGLKLTCYSSAVRAHIHLATSTTLAHRPTWPKFSSDPLDDQINLAQIRTRSSSRSGPPCSNLARSTERPGLLSHRRSVPCVGPCPLLARTQSVQVLSSNFSAQVYLINFSDSSCGTRSTLRPDPLWDHSHFSLCMYMHNPTLVYIYIYILALDLSLFSDRGQWIRSCSGSSR